MTAQIPLPFDPEKERVARDRALNLFERTRQELLAVARVIALEIFQVRGRVTAPEVFGLLKDRGFEEALGQVDPRFMGAVFREGSGWRRIGWENKGSHRRPVSIWVRKEAP